MIALTLGGGKGHQGNQINIVHSFHISRNKNQNQASPKSLANNLTISELMMDYSIEDSKL